MSCKGIDFALSYRIIPQMNKHQTEHDIIVIGAPGAGLNPCKSLSELLVRLSREPPGPAPEIQLNIRLETAIAPMECVA
jgi:hypothetical protein